MAAVSEPFEPGLEQILVFCAQDPIERVFLEDVARRRLGRFTAFAEDEVLTALCRIGATWSPPERTAVASRLPLHAAAPAW